LTGRVGKRECSSIGLYRRKEDWTSKLDRVYGTKNGEKENDNSRNNNAPGSREKKKREEPVRG